MRSRSIKEMGARAEDLGLSLLSTRGELEWRHSQDEETLDTLRSVAPAGVADAEVGADGIPQPRWEGRRPAPAAPESRPAHDPRTWISVLDDPRVLPGGPLTSFEVGVKDLMAVEGLTVTAGTRAHRATPAGRNAAAVHALREAGATICGTTNLHALAYGATGTSSERGTPDNPAAPGTIPGGSSSGSAVAVADGSAALTLGTDTSGSIRIPAALCGVVGHKPSRGLVSADGCHPLSPALDHIGPLSRTVEVAAAAMAVLAGWDGWRLPDEPRDPLRVGVLSGYFDEGLDPRVRRAMEGVVTHLTGTGVELDLIDLPAARHVPGAQLAILSTDALASNLATLRERGEQLPTDVRLRLEAGLARTPEQYAAALALGDRWRAQVDTALRRHHVLLSPTTAITAPRPDVAEVQIGGRPVTVQFSLTRLTMPFNLSGHPAITLPFRDSKGTLIGVQLVGWAGGDKELLGVADYMERVLDRPRS